MEPNSEIKIEDAPKQTSSRTITKQPDGKYVIVDVSEITIRKEDLLAAKADMGMKLGQAKQNVKLIEEEIAKVDKALAE